MTPSPASDHGQPLSVNVHRSGVSASLLLVTAWLAATVAPWWLLDHQQHLHRTGNLDALWPLYTLLTGGFFALMACLLVLKDRPLRLTAPAPGMPGRLMVALLLLLPAAFLLQRELRAFARMIWFRPMSHIEGDMLPLLHSALRDFWRDGVYPYRFHEAGTWELALTFTPGLWLPYSLPYLAGVDIRWAGLAAMACACLACLAWAGWLVFRSQRRHGWLYALPVLWLPIAMLWLEYFDDFLSASHLAVYWAVAILAAMALRLRLHGTAGLLLGWCLISRVYLLFAVPFVAIHTWRLWQHDRREAVRLAVAFVLPGLAVGLPFLLWNPVEFTRGMLSGYDEQLSWHIANTPYFSHGLGWTGLMQQLGVDRWGMALSLILQVPLWVDAWRRLRTGRDLLLYSAAAVALFVSFSMVPWFYVYILPLIFLSFAFPEEELSLRRERSRRLASAGAGAATLAIVVCVLAWSGLRDVRHGSFPSDGASPLYFEARHPVWGFDYHGWVGNAPGDWHLVTGPDAFVALPVRDTAAGVVEIFHRGAPAGVEPVVYMNHERLEVLPSSGPGRIAAFVPRGNLFRGGNLLRVTLLDSDGNPVSGWEIGRIQLHAPPQAARQ